MAELVAIDVEQGPVLPQLLDVIWGRGDAACVVDQRLVGRARERHLSALAPTRLHHADGTETPTGEERGVPDGVALVVTTSGSTAAPRAVLLTHDAVGASAAATSSRLEVDPAHDRWLCCLPCAHVGGLSVVTRAMRTGTPLDVHPGFDATRVARAAATGVTLVSLVTTALRELADPGRFRTILLGGAAPPEERPDNVVTTWGMTETGSGVVYDGVPLSGAEVVDHDGELFVRGPMLASAYRDGTPVTGCGPDGTDGWLATGDGGRVTDGVVEVFGRMADVITTGGEKVWPDDVERVLATHPSIAEVAVWRRPDERWGERVVAWVVPVGALPTVSDLRRHVEGALPPWAAPKEVVAVPTLPRAPSGKVARRRLDSDDPA